MKTLNRKLIARDGYVRCNSTVLSARAFEARQQTWLTLKREDCHLLWHPQFVDYGLNRVPGAANIQTIVKSERFVRACQQFASAGDTSLKHIRITPDLLLHPSGGTLLQTFLQVQTKRMMEELKVADQSELNREELSATLRHQFIVLWIRSVSSNVHP